VKAVRRGPYADAAAGYWEEGWTPLPLPIGAKTPPPKGWTGGSKANSGELPSAGQVQAWIEDSGAGNICLRAPKSVIGIDVDMYDGKAGRETLAAAEAAWGELPATWISTSRTDGSGIRWYRIEEGLAWPGQLPQGGGIELIRWDHRYGVVAPSTNPINGGAEYVWLNPAGESTTDDEGWDFPAIADLPWLPDAWQSGLTEGKVWTPRAEADMDPIEIKDWLTARGEGEPCSVMQRTLQKWLQEIRKAGADGGAHDMARDGVWAVIGDSAAGHSGIRPALERLMEAFKVAMKSRDPNRDWRGEWRRFVNDGVRKVAAEGDPEDDDPCEMLETSRPARERKRGGSSGMTFERSDKANGGRFADRYKNEVRYVEALGGWHIWNGVLWAPDLDGEAMRMAMATVDAMEEEAKFIEDEKQRAKFLAFISSSANIPKLEAMLKAARSMKGITIPSSAFDAAPEVLVVGNGTLELKSSGARFRPSRQEDYNTMALPTPYKPKAVSDLWDKFLARSIPDEEVRDWVQRAAGYSLFGANPERLFFIVEGKTSSGKSTFVETLRAVLGPYGATFELNLFRSQKEQGPNVQLVRLLPKRFVVASEASAEQFLHADQLKRVTGGEALSGRLNRSNEMVERAPAFTPWLATNAAPTIRGADQALYRRMYTIPFNETIPVDEEQGDLGARLRSEGAEGVLSWLVTGWNRYCEDGLRNLPDALVRATMKTREELSDFDVWLNEDCERGPEHVTLTSDLYTAYRDWCTESEVRPESKVEFGRLLAKRGLEPKMVRTTPHDRDKKARGWAGIRLIGRETTGKRKLA
jgi:P4 family phage/plasmid primase-like protien